AALPQPGFPLLDPVPGEDSGFDEVLWFGQEPHQAGLKSEVVAATGAEVAVPVNYQPPRDANKARRGRRKAPLPVVFVGVLDDQVVPLNDQSVLHGAVMPGQLSWVPLTVRAPDEPGLHQLFVLAFPNPYAEDKAAVNSERGFAVLSSQRMMIGVS
ncbi:MAG: hypothetical protein IT337_17310, partial [Thermomicrobiales bacterium]|nr:hypothetical protein [Thermomicrobiales bacterium]